jgi:hypothetical protein
MLATIVKSTLLGLVLGAALAYAAELGPAPRAGDPTRDESSAPVHVNNPLSHGSRAIR